tara:strand:- start:1349 stop:1555 length:207 start_codon:yes stop_codon:yes gene_type:complete
MDKKEKIRAQVKSRWYYIFWGTATFAVVAGQVFVGSGFRQMSNAFNRVLDAAVIELELTKDELRRFMY